MRDYYLYTWYIRVAERLKTEDLRKFRKFRIVSKLDGIITSAQSSSHKENLVNTNKRLLENRN